MVKRVPPVLWAIVLAIGACATARAAVLPGGFVPLPDGDGATITWGISAGVDAGDCCWMAREAAFTAWQPPDADRLIVGLFAPPYALRVREPVDVSVNGHTQRLCCVQPGGSQLVVHLASASTLRRLEVELRFVHDFRPADAGHGPDRRRLSVLLRGVAFEDMRTGALLKGATEPVAPPLLPSTFRAGLMLAVLVAAAALTFVRPSLGVAALIASDPFALGVEGFGTTWTLSKAAVIGVTLAVAISSARRAPRFGPAFAAIAGTLAFVVFCAAIASHGANDLHAAIRETLKLLEYALVFAIVYLAFRDDPSGPTLLRTLALTALAVVGLALGQLAIGAAPNTLFAGRLLPRLAGPLEGPNQLAGFLDLCIPLLLASVLYVRRQRLASTALVLAGFALLLTLSRGGIVAGIAGVVVVAVARYRPRRLTPALVTLGIVWSAGIAISIAVGFGAMPFAAALFGATGDWRGGLGTRTLLWHNAIAQWHAHPWFGVGPGNFELLSYVMSGIRTHANSLYLNALAETGITGFTAILAFTVLPIVVFLRRARGWIVAGVLGSSTALALHQVVDTLWIYPKVGVLGIVFLGIAAAVCDTLPEREHVVDLAA